MVLGLLTIAGIPTTIATTQGVSQQKKEQRAAKRMEDCNLSVFCDGKSRKRSQVHGKSIVLRDSKVYIGTSAQGYPFKGFYMPYPNDQKPLGLVSMISDDPPAMNFIYVDRDTMELKYANRTGSMEHIVGPWDFTDDEKGLTLMNTESFVAVEEDDGVWAVYFDSDGGTSLPRSKNILAISIEREPLESQQKAN